MSRRARCAAASGSVARSHEPFRMEGGEQGLALEITRDALDEHGRFEHRVVTLEPNRDDGGRARRGVDPHEPRALGGKEVRFFAKPSVDGRVGAANDEIPDDLIQRLEFCLREDIDGDGTVAGEPPR
ncbi:MAG: hypothetical protein ACO35E_08955 [Ilumatobacteraceae bacterium]